MRLILFSRLFGRFGAFGARRFGGTAVFCLFFLLAPRAVRADGGTVRLRQEKGPFVVTVFTAQQVATGVPADISVMVQRRETGEVVLGAAVDLSLQPPGSASGAPPLEPLCAHCTTAPVLDPARGTPRLPATHEQATNKLLYAAWVVFPADGTWNLRTAVRSGDETAEVSCELPVAAPVNRFAGLWAYLAMPPIAVALFAANRWLSRRRRTDGFAPRL